MNFNVELQIFTNLFLIFGLAVVFNRIETLRDCSTNNATESHKSDGRPVAWIIDKNNKYDHLFHVINILERLGYHVHTDNTKPDWSLLWTHKYPFSQPDLLDEIKAANSKQRVNHVPGSGYVTSKVFLAQTPLQSGVPLAFSLPEQKQRLIEYAQKNPSIQWVQKSNAHRGIEIARLHDLDLNKKDVFVQQFIDNPLLIDGRKFDLGIYTVVTSLSPLRVYIYGGDILLRFCSQPYLPFDAKNLDKYVVGDDYTPIWEMPSFHTSYNEQKLTTKESFHAYLGKNDVDHLLIWKQIRQIIREVFELNNERMRALLSNYKDPSRFFEMVRFDFIIDEKYKVYLMEANMSPNLSSGHFKPNALLYEQVLFNLFSLVGLASHSYAEGRLTEIEVSDRNLSIDLPECLNGVCTDCSRNQICGLCSSCMSSDLREHLRLAYREHLNRKQMRRVVPSTKSSPVNLTLNDKLQRLWFERMCKRDVSFCDD